MLVQDNLQKKYETNRTCSPLELWIPPSKRLELLVKLVTVRMSFWSFIYRHTVSATVHAGDRFLIHPRSFIVSFVGFDFYNVRLLYGHLYQRLLFTSVTALPVWDTGQCAVQPQSSTLPCCHCVQSTP